MTYVNIDYSSRRPISAQIIDQTVRMITSGVLRPGDWLPSVRQLATELSINPNTIQKAYSEMETRGIIVSVKGRGSFVAEDMAGTSGALRDKLTASLAEAVHCARLLSLTPEEIEKELRAQWSAGDIYSNNENGGLTAYESGDRK